MQRVLLKPKYRFQTTFGSKSRAKPTLRLPLIFCFHATYSFPAHPSPLPAGEGMGEGKTHATAVVMKPTLPVFRRPQLCRKRKPKRSSVGYAHDHAVSNTTRSSEKSKILTPHNSSSTKWTNY
ncbi:hypothetical protein NEIMUCOT_04923 [Neisseria mucosa ATCC 25996]|uniref:Uncharacterized protein n=1 Tax=Neisseria mucosa (strain ATCC 25996 / DSM 4631 / NCTC 10774 / M26) TaxID=546266 RepID=D2ZWD0_NEIM2|nr:hypothetical protein NEIMUCOT_04923 [Neisseria mucosa ATCC 25996]